METLVDFLKNSTTLDLLVVVITLILILAGILLLSVGRSRRSMYGLLVVAALPLLLGCVSMYLKSQGLRLGFDKFVDAPTEAIEAGKREAPVIAYVGAAGTGVLVSIGLSGLALKKSGRPDQVKFH